MTQAPRPDESVQAAKEGCHRLTVQPSMTTLHAVANVGTPLGVVSRR